MLTISSRITGDFYFLHFCKSTRFNFFSANTGILIIKGNKLLKAFIYRTATCGKLVFPDNTTRFCQYYLKVNGLKGKKNATVW